MDYLPGFVEIETEFGRTYNLFFRLSLARP